MPASNTINADLVVLGAGPGGYSAAYRAADLFKEEGSGKTVVMIDDGEALGGVCLNVGCIPSKAYLHIAKVLTETQEMAAHGIDFGKPKIDADKLRAWKNSVVKRLTGGLDMLAKKRKVTVVQGTGKFISPTEIEVIKGSEKTIVKFSQCIIAAGSRPINLPFMPQDKRVIDSTGALELPELNCKLLILGGGIIGLEMGTVYEALGAEVHVVELMDQLMPGADKDLVAPLHKRMEKRFKSIMLETKVTAVEAKKDGLYVTFEGKNAPDQPQKFDYILQSVGRRPNSDQLSLDKAGVSVDQRGFITVDNQQRTNVANIFAIGDIVGNPMLAHKAVPEGHLAAEVIAGKKHIFDPKTIPSVAYTDPEVAWAGLTETEAKAKGIKYAKGVFPWLANGRSLSMGRSEGLTKLLFDPDTKRILGGGITGTNAGDLICEVALAIEMGCDAEDIALTIHPHPTLGETIMLAAEVFEGTVTDL
ncbi:MAG: dihydrolipoyl dehydrogenase [Gammaproteobacteria bacterium]|nr:dihydrolipoyl dehydrogenase [Gammaproteobacteria bacterium]